MKGQPQECAETCPEGEKTSDSSLGILLSSCKTLWKMKLLLVIQKMEGTLQEQIQCNDFLSTVGSLICNYSNDYLSHEFPFTALTAICAMGRLLIEHCMGFSHTFHACSKEITLQQGLRKVGQPCIGWTMLGYMYLSS